MSASACVGDVWDELTTTGDGLGETVSLQPLTWRRCEWIRRIRIKAKVKTAVGTVVLPEGPETAAVKITFCPTVTEEELDKRVVVEAVVRLGSKFLVEG